MKEIKKRISFQDVFAIDDQQSKKIKIKFNIQNNTDFEKGPVMAHELLSAYQEGSDSEIADRWLEMLEWREPSNHNHNLDNCTHLLAFAQYPRYGTNCYIFGGYYKITLPDENKGKAYKGRGYKLKPEDRFEKLINRLVLKFEKPIGRTYTRTYQSIKELNPEVVTILPLNDGVGPFVGYNETCLTHAQLQKILAADAPDWRDALSRIKAVYCITDTSNGKLYIGSANATNSQFTEPNPSKSAKGTQKKKTEIGIDHEKTPQGLWGRWQYYADENDLTGDNEYFNKIIKGQIDGISDGKKHIKEYFTYTILEIFDIRTADNVVCERERFWKKVFCTVVSENDDNWQSKRGMNFNW